MKNIFSSLLIVIMSSSFTGCATIINSPHQSIPITSSPQGAKVTVDGANSYITPTEVKLERKKDHQLVFQKDDYEDLTFVIKHGLSGAVAGNILLGGLIGWGVDAATGAQFKLIPETVSVTLARKGDTEAIQLQQSLTQKLDELDILLKDKRITPEQYNSLKLEALNNQNKVAK